MQAWGWPSPFRIEPRASLRRGRPSGAFGNFQATMSDASEETTSRATRGGAGKNTVIGSEAVKFHAGSCEELSRASLKCIEDLGYDKTAAKTASATGLQPVLVCLLAPRLETAVDTPLSSCVTQACKEHYDAYRDCRKAENDARLAANAEFAKRNRLSLASMFGR
jgi:hypothetical protein